jgi:hypothetical protein
MEISTIIYYFLLLLLWHINYLNLSTFQSRWLLRDVIFLTIFFEKRPRCSLIIDIISLHVPTGPIRGFQILM